jgi:uncharacterized glyoxalase superfamily protein PhnB
MPPTIRLEVEDLVPAGAFYRALFGASEQTASPDGTLRLEASAFDVSLVLIPKPRRAAEPRAPVLELRVDDVRAWLRHAAGLGATVLFADTTGTDGVLRPASPDEALHYAHVRDPFGYLWAVDALPRAESPRGSTDVYRLVVASGRSGWAGPGVVDGEIEAFEACLARTLGDAEMRDSFGISSYVADRLSRYTRQYARSTDSLLSAKLKLDAAPSWGRQPVVMRGGGQGVLFATYDLRADRITSLRSGARR